jgi:hypothetical protein
MRRSTWEPGLKLIVRRDSPSLGRDTLTPGLRAGIVKKLRSLSQ